MGPMGRRYVQALGLIENAKLVAFADKREEALANAGAVEAKPYLDALVMMREVRPEIVVVASNGPSHHSLVLGAIEAGARGILCEKPMSCSVAEAEEMIACAREHGCSLAVNFWKRHEPGYQWLADRIQSGEYGQLRSIRTSWPGIGLGCRATHAVDLWRFFSGEEVSTVFGWVDPVRGPNPRGAEFCDPGGMVVATSASGARYIHEQTEDGAGPGVFIIETTGAQLVLDDFTRSVAILVRDLSVKPGPNRPPKYDAVQLPADAPVVNDMIRFTAASLSELVDGRELTCGAEHGLRSLEIVVGAHISHESGHAPVALPFTDSESKAKWLPIT